MSSPYFRSINFQFEWSDDEETVVIPEDDVLNLKPVQTPKPLTLPLIDFREVILKTINEYQSILDAKLYKDEEDKLKIEATIAELRA